MNDETSVAKSLSRIDEGTITRLRARLALAADAEGILDIAYRMIDSPVGPLLLASTPRGLVQVAFQNEDSEQVLAELSRKISPRVLQAPHKLDPAAFELDQYFDGKRTRFDLPIDYRLSSGFRREVLTHLPEIPYGNTASYGDVARMSGNPRAVRAVGTACGTNPLPIVIPCHRVIRMDGSLGNYVGGAIRKQQLLQFEEGLLKSR